MDAWKYEIYFSFSRVEHDVSLVFLYSLVRYPEWSTDLK